MAAGIEYYTSSNKWGWRLRNAAGAIEYTRTATFATQALAIANAANDTRLQMASLGIKEAPAANRSVIVTVSHDANGGRFDLTASGFTPDQVRRDGGTPPVAGDTGWTGTGTSLTSLREPAVSYVVGLRDPIDGSWISTVGSTLNAIPPTGTFGPVTMNGTTAHIPFTGVTPTKISSSTWSTDQDPYVLQQAILNGFIDFTNIATADTFTLLPGPLTTHTPAGYPPVIPPTTGFSIQGSKIVGPSGNTFIPKGLNLVGPHVGGSGNGATTAGSWDFYPVWNMNIVRLNTAPWGTGNDQNNDLTGLVTGFASRNIVCMVEIHADPSGDTSGRYLGGNLTAVGDWWVAFAQQWKDNPYVWFNIYNEPGADSNPVSSQWKTEAEYLIQRIRAVASNVIVCDGAAWGQDAGWSVTVDSGRSAILTYGPYLASKYPNVMFSFHLYDQWTQGAAKLTDFITRAQGAGLAVMVGEVADWNGSNAASFRPALDAAFNVCPGKGVGILPWHGQGQGDWYGLLTDSRWLGDINNTLAPTNLTYQGQRMWNYTHS